MSSKQAIYSYVSEVIQGQLQPHFVGVRKDNAMQAKRTRDINTEKEFICLNTLDMLGKMQQMHIHKIELFKCKINECGFTGETKGEDSQRQLLFTKKAALTSLLQEILPSFIFVEVHDRIMNPGQDGREVELSQRQSFWDEIFDMLQNMVLDRKDMPNHFCWLSLGSKLILRKANYNDLLEYIEQATDEFRKTLESEYDFEIMMHHKSVRDRDIIPETPQDSPEHSHHHSTARKKLDLEDDETESEEMMIESETHSVVISNLSSPELPSVEEILATYKNIPRLMKKECLYSFKKIESQTEDVVESLIPYFVSMEKEGNPDIRLIHESDNGFEDYVKSGPKDLGTVILNNRVRAQLEEEARELLSKTGVETPELVHILRNEKYFSKIITPMQIGQHFISLVFIRNEKKCKNHYDCWVINSVTEAETDKKTIDSIMCTITPIQRYTIMNRTSRDACVSKKFGFTVEDQIGSRCPYFCTLNCLSFAMDQPVRVTNTHVETLCRTMVVYIYNKMRCDAYTKLQEICNKRQDMDQVIKNFMTETGKRSLKDLWTFIRQRCQVKPYDKDWNDHRGKLHEKHGMNPNKTNGSKSSEEILGYVTDGKFYKVIGDFIIEYKEITRKGHKGEQLNNLAVEVFHKTCDPYIIKDKKAIQEFVSKVIEACKYIFGCFDRKRFENVVHNMQILEDLDAPVKGSFITNEGHYKSANKKSRKQ